MVEKFNNWNELKKNLHFNKKRDLHIKEKEIYFLSVGQNIGYESFGKGKYFLRPVIVFKKTSRDTFIGIPLTSKEKEGSYYFRFQYKKDKISTALLNQIRIFDIKRIKYYSGNIKKEDFDKLKLKISEFLSITPPQNEGGGILTKKSEQRKDERSIAKNNLVVKCIDDNYSTARLCYKLIDDKYLDENGKIKEEYKFKLNFPEFGIVDSKIPAKEVEKFTKESKAFDTLLFLPEGEGRKGEGGLRTNGYFKFSYEKVGSEWYIASSNSEKIKKIELPTINYPLPTTCYPLITIVTVVYNGEEFLEETILSVINQTYDNVEYIIVDGGSSDGTIDIIKKYEDRIDYWVSEKDKGIYDAMNKGIVVALGKYLFFLGADDILLDNSLNNLMSNIRNDNNLIVFPITIGNSKKSPDCSLPAPIIHHQGALFPMKQLKKVGYYSDEYNLHADYDLMLNIIHQYGIDFIDSSICRFRKGGVSTSGKNALISIKELLNIYFKNHGKIFSIKWIMFIVRPMYYYLSGVIKK